MIVTDPAATAVLDGGNASFTVVATGPNLLYQWSRGGTDLPGQTSATLTLEAVTAAQAGNYQVRVRNSGGAVTSVAARLTVLSPVTLVQTWPAEADPAVCRDTHLRLTSSAPVALGTQGRLRIHRRDTGEVVETVDFATAQPQKNVDGLTFNYRPVTLSGTTARVELSSTTALVAGGLYYVTLEPGCFVDASGAWFGGVSDPAAWRFAVKAALPTAEATTLVIAADGTGDFQTVQGALDFCPPPTPCRACSTSPRASIPNTSASPPAKTCSPCAGAVARAHSSRASTTTT